MGQQTTLIFASIALLCFNFCKKKEDESPPQLIVKEYCENTCVFSNDGDCDDGGPGAQYDYCELGTDCADCGVRTETTVKD